MRPFSRWVVACLVALVFLAPLKFGTPVMLQSVLVPPGSWFEWLFFAWPNQLMVVFGFAVFMWLVLDPDRMRAPADALLVLPLVFLLTQAVASAGTINRQVSADTVALFAVCVLVFYAGAWYVRDGAAAGRVFGGLAIATVLVCIFALDQRFGGLDETRQYAALYLDPAQVPRDYWGKLSSNRVFGTMVYPNALAGFLAVAFAPTLAWAWVRGRNWDRRVRWLALGLAAALMTYCLLLTGSRGGLLAFVAAALAGLWGLWGMRTPRTKMLFTLLFAGVAVAGAVFVVMQRGGTIGRGTGSIEARLDYWRGAMAIARTHPWLGTGPGTFGSIYPKYKIAETEEAQAVHNSYLQMWSDSGVLAFLAFAALWLVAMRDAFRLVRTRSGDVAAVAICAGLTGWVVHGFVDVDLYIPGIAVPAFFLLGAVQGLKEFQTMRLVRPHTRSKWILFLMCAGLVGSVAWAEGRSLAGTLAHGRAEAWSRTDPVAAYEEAKRAVASVGWSAYYCAEAADLALSLGRFEEAIDLYQQAIANDPNRAAYWWRLAGAQIVSQGLGDEALESLRQATALNPTNPVYLQGLAAAEESVRQSRPGLLQSNPAE